MSRRMRPSLFFNRLAKRPEIQARAFCCLDGFQAPPLVQVYQNRSYARNWRERTLHEFGERR